MPWNAQRARARAAGAFKAGREEFTYDGELPATEFAGYESLAVSTEILPLHFDAESGRLLFTAKLTPFYVESGGQVADDGSASLNWATTLCMPPYWECCAVTSPFCIRPRSKGIHPELQQAVIGKLWIPAILRVTREHRIPTEYNHTSTHLLHAALRAAFGEHVHQAGSDVGPDYLRSDYTHFEKPTTDELHRIEAQVNEWIRGNYGVAPRTLLPA